MKYSTIKNPDFSETQLIPFTRAMEFIRKYFSSKLPWQDFNELKGKVLL